MGGIVAIAAWPVAAQAADDRAFAAGLPIFAWLVALAVTLTVLWKLDAIRPGSLARAGHEPPKPNAALPLSVTAMGVYLLPAVLAVMLFRALVGAPADTPSLRETGLLTLLSYGLGATIAALACWFAVRAAWLRADAVRPRPRDAWVGLVAIALAWPSLWAAGQAARLVVMLTGGDTGGELQHGTLELLTAGDRESPWWWAVLAGAVLGAPIVEEVTFRGLLQPAIRAALGPWSAVLIPGGLFVLLHVPQGAESSGATWLAIPTLAVLALALGIARERTGRLGVPIVMHMLFNAANVALAFGLKTSA